MEWLRLKEEVVFEGKNKKGEKGTITFGPSDQPGWYFKDRTEAIPLSAEILKQGYLHGTRIDLNGTAQTFDPLICCLKWLGTQALSVHLSTNQPLVKLPELWEKIRGASEPCAQRPWCTVEKPVRVARGGRNTVIYPCEQGLFLGISCHQKGLGIGTLSFSLPGDEKILMEAVMRYHEPLSLPKKSFFSKFKFAKPATDPQKEENAREIMRLIMLKRLVELLSILSLAHSAFFLSAYVTSSYSEEWTDIQAVKQAATHLDIKNEFFFG